MIRQLSESSHIVTQSYRQLEAGRLSSRMCIEMLDQIFTQIYPCRSFTPVEDQTIPFPVNLHMPVGTPVIGRRLVHLGQ